MKNIIYTYKFRLNPDKEQQYILNRYFGCVRFVYNHFLNQRKEEYVNNKKSITYNQQSSFLTKLKKDPDYQWLKEINSQTLQYSLNCLDIAYQSFFKKRSGFPRFKSRKTKNTFTVPQSVKVEDNYLIIPKFKGGIKMVKHRNIEGLIKKCSISKTSTGKYYVSILVEKEYQPVKKTNKNIGMDLGLNDFISLSNGSKTKGIRYLKKYERKLSLNQKHLSRKTRGSKRYEKQRLKVCRIHEKISNSRSDMLHKITFKLINEFDTIYIEDLNIKGMIKNRKLSKSISDVSWGRFIDILSYKCDWNDKQLIKVDRFFPSSKTCNKCSHINQNLKLHQRKWICNKCGAKLDRDINAAINILKEGLRLNISDGTSDNDRGAKIRPNNFSELNGISNETIKEKVYS
ncbi:MAG: RNA-guided endonuclease TnpB family protein [Saccharofermentanales bacterium]